MSTAPTTTTPGLLTAEEFARRDDPGHPEELVKGGIVAMPVPGARHGYVCSRASLLVNLYLMEHNVGRVLGNDSGVVTERGPDSVRGPDVSFYRYERMPLLPVGYPDVPSDLVFEVLS